MKRLAHHAVVPQGARVPGDNEQYLADQLDQIHRSMRQGDVDGVVRQVGHVRGESDSQTADTLMRLALDRELKESRKKIRIWTAAAIVLAVGAAISIAAAVSKLRLDTLTDTATTVTATVSSTVPVPVATAPTSSAVPPVPGPDGSNFTVLHELTDFTLGNAISCFNNVEGTLDIDDLAPNADKPTFSSCLSEFRFDVGRYIARMPSVAQPAA